MKLQVMLLAGTCGLASTLFAQQVAAPIVDLNAKDKVEVPLTRRSSMTYGAVCDGAGNVYVRRLEPEIKDHQERAALPIRKIKPAGDLAGSFRVTARGELF